ncbi:MAG: tRNA lysidine(34) synthetase TilS [Rhodothermales bacterium]
MNLLHNTLMLNQVRHYIDARQLLFADAPVIVGVSGGVDSMVLLHILQSLSYSVICAHVNYRMRDAASDGDEAFVNAYCREAKIPCFVHRVTDAFLTEDTNGSFQVRAREARYAFFQELAEEQNVKTVAVAHHLDDQAETVLMHLMRGSGIEGLSGMPADRVLDHSSDIKLIRPLLSLPRSEIQDYAIANHIDWRKDASNSDTKYHRNKIRHGLLDTIRKDFGAGAVQNIARSAGYLRGYVDSSIQPALEHKFASIALDKEGLDIARLGEEHPVWQERIILEACRQWYPESPVTRHHARAIRQLLTAQVGRRLIVDALTVWRDRKQLKFASSPEEVNESAEYLLVENQSVAFSDATLHVQVRSYTKGELLEKGPAILCADASKVQFPLRLRRWQPGDAFVPFGMSGTKKVSDYLTDIKIGPDKRNDIWVLLSGNEVIWIVGYRAGDAIKVTPKTTQMLVCRMGYTE